MYRVFITGYIPPSAGQGWLGSYFESLSECLSLSPSFFILKILPSSVGLGLTFFGESLIRKHKNTKLTNKDPLHCLGQ